MRMKLKEKTPAASTSAVPADHSSNWDEQVVAEELSNNHTDGPPLQSVPVAFTSNDQRFYMDAAIRERSRMAFKVKAFGGRELQKEWKLRCSDADLRLHLERQGVSRDMIRRMVMVSARHLSRKDYDGIVAVTKLIPLVNFKPLSL